MASPAEHLGSAEQSLWGARDELRAAASESANPDTLSLIAEAYALVEAAFNIVRPLRERSALALPAEFRAVGGA